MARPKAAIAHDIARNWREFEQTADTLAHVGESLPDEDLIALIDKCVELNDRQEALLEEYQDA
jgi:hypothetical protein